MQNPFAIVIQNQADDEEIIRTWRHHPFTLLRPTLRVIAFLLIPLALVVITGLSMFSSTVLFVLFVLIICMVLTYAAYEWVSWYNDVYILTNYRVIDVKQDGFFHRRFAEANLNRVQDISFSTRGLAQTLLNFGNVEVSTAGPQENLRLVEIKRPDAQAAFLLKQQQAYLASHDDTMTAEQLLTLLAKHGDKLDQLSKLEKEEKIDHIDEQLSKVKQAKRKASAKRAKKEAKEL